MDAKRLIQISKYLSKHLRHEPHQLGLELQPGGWVEVAELLNACARHQMAISRQELEEVVRGNDKQRFAFDDVGTRIRANQGHSVAVDLNLEPLTPPALLYHGTSTNNLDVIRRVGLSRMARHHVHLSQDVATARKVGSRHGQPVVLLVAASAMHQAGIPFYRSANGVWLVEAVPPEYLRLLEDH